MITGAHIETHDKRIRGYRIRERRRKWREGGAGPWSGSVMIMDVLNYFVIEKHSRRF